MKLYKSLHLLVLYFYFAKSQTTQVISKHNESFREAFSLIRECSNSDIILCLKEKIIKMIETLPKEFQLSAGITVKENGKPKLSRNFDEIVLPTNRSERAEIVNNVLLEKITEFVDNHLVELKMPDEMVDAYKMSFLEGRKNKKKKSLLPYLLLFKAKVVAIIAFFVKFISLMALKALILAKMAIALTVGIVLKRLSEYSSRYPSRLFEFQQQLPYDNNYWRRLMNEDAPYYRTQMLNLPYPIINNEEN